jgi:hypothetical protein
MQDKPAPNASGIPLRLVWQEEPQHVPADDIEDVEAAVRTWVGDNVMDWQVGSSNTGHFLVNGLDIMAIVECREDNIGKLFVVLECEGPQPQVQIVWDCEQPQDVPDDVWDQAKAYMENWINDNSSSWANGDQVQEEFPINPIFFLMEVRYDDPGGGQATATIISCEAEDEIPMPNWAEAQWPEQKLDDAQIEQIEEETNDWIEDQRGWFPGQTFEFSPQNIGLDVTVTIAARYAADGKSLEGVVQQVEVEESGPRPRQQMATDQPG